MKNLKFKAEYASDVMSVIPAGYIDKTVCGCGLSTVALENSVDTIIAVPSVELIRNKIAQYPNSRSSNVILGVYGGVSKSDIEEYLSKNSPIKIMVTYDSLHRIEHLLDVCHLVIDESNKLLSSSELKSKSKSTSKTVDITTKVFDIAERYKDTVSFISATPTPLEYMPTWVSEIEQIKMEWENTIKATPILLERTYPYKSLTNEILRPLNTENVLNLGNTTIKKVIVFMNSVESIVRVCKDSELSKEDVAIIASTSIENDVKIKGYNRLSNPNNLPKYTFVTSSGFEGIDLNDDDAISVVVSNTSKSYQMIDVLTDLKQAISRQRNKKNPNYSKFVYLYNQSIFSQTKEELEAELDDRYSSLVNAIYLWEVAKTSDKRSGFKYTEDNKDFITYTNYTEENETYTINENLFKADRYFILNIREQYQKGFDIKGDYTSYEVIEKPEIIADVDYKGMVELYNATGDIEQYSYKYDYYKLINDCVKLYGKVWTDQTYAKKMVEEYHNEYGRLILTLRTKFQEGKIYAIKTVKTILQEVYNEYQISRTAKSTDLQEFMLVREFRSNQGRYVEVINKYKTVK